MTGPRLHVGGMLAVVGGLGFALAGLTVATEPWLVAAGLLALVVPLTAVVGSIFRRGRARAFWAGVAIFGWGARFLLEPSAGADLDRPMLRLAERLFVEVPVPVVPDSFPPLAAPPTFPLLQPGVSEAPDPAESTKLADEYRALQRRRDEAERHNQQAVARQIHFVSIVPALLVVALALLGGLIARGFFDRTAAEATAGREGAGP